MSSTDIARCSTIQAGGFLSAGLPALHRLGRTATCIALFPQVCSPSSWTRLPGSLICSVFRTRSSSGICWSCFSTRASRRALASPPTTAAAPGPPDTQFVPDSVQGHVFLLGRSSSSWGLLRWETAALRSAQKPGERHVCWWISLPYHHRGRCWCCLVAEGANQDQLPHFFLGQSLLP